MTRDAVSDSSLNGKVDEGVPRGFALYVRLSESAARKNGTDLRDLVDALQHHVAAVAPAAETLAVAVIPRPEIFVVIRMSRSRVYVGGRDLALSPQEFALFDFFMRHEGITLTREQLRWATGSSENRSPRSRTVDVHIHRLRTKLDNYGDLISTVHGAGYRVALSPNFRLLWDR